MQKLLSSVASPLPTVQPSTGAVLASLGMATLLPALGSSGANVALPTLAVAFASSLGAVQWVVLAYLLTLTALVVGAGRLGDLLGRRRLLLLGLLLFTAGSACCALAPGLGTLIAARALQGMAASVLTAMSLALVAETLPAAKRGAAMGLLGSMSAIGTAMGPALGGLLLHRFGWPAIFLPGAALAAIALLLALRSLPADPPRQARAAGLDPLGTAVLALALVTYALAMTLGHNAELWLKAGLLIAAVLSAGLFLRVERQAKAPLIQPAMLHNRRLSGGCAMSLLVSTVMMATLLLGPFYLTQALGLDPAQTGLILAAGPLVAALSGLPAGKLVDRLGSARLTLAGLALIATACTALALLPETLGIPGYIAPLVLLTLGYAVFQAANNAAVMTAAGPANRGTVAGLLSLSRNLGLITGASVPGVVFLLAAGVDEIALASPAAVAHGLRVSFAGALGVVLVAGGVGLWVIRRPVD